MEANIVLRILAIFAKTVSSRFIMIRMVTNWDRLKRIIFRDSGTVGRSDNDIMCDNLRVRVHSLAHFLPAV